ncbi:DUF294 nucleotidyltransferase-like domain-containing protein [Ottowia sp.]|uniref:DUF294 nucleotidyltransferase-like domain-containing protein n=1 Tax=Ottowia sp. TaxID=1898956 RepID=UPI003A864056
MTDFASAPSPDTMSLLGTHLADLIRRPPLVLAPDVSIQAAAQAMRDAGASSVMLMQGNHLVGLATDRDLRNRVVAENRALTDSIQSIATADPVSLPGSASALDALMLMARRNIHHVPVVDQGQVLGMVTATDVSEQQGTSAVFLSKSIFHAPDADTLATLSLRIKPMQQALATAGVSAYAIGHVVTAITDALTVRLIQLAEADLGAPPVDYAWVAAGSQARMEQTAKSDQDNCLLLSDDFDAATHDDYFKALARSVNAGLDACGYIYCPGDMMAQTDQWRQPMRQWRDYFRQWVDVPEPMALMLSSVFFDLRCVHGNAGLLHTLRRDVLARTKGNTLFLGHMVANALKNRPPLGLFGRLTLIKDGANANTLDLKHSGVVPIVDLARICALAGGLDVVNTSDRLSASGAAGTLSPGMARDLRDALEFLSRLRVSHQARQVGSEQAPDNFLKLEELSDFDRGHMKDAFTLVQQMQSVLKSRY